MANLYRLAYVSSAQQRYSKADLLDLLNQAREKNARLGLSGMLLYKDGNFMQLIEGEESAVHLLFKAISADPKHHQIVVLLDEPIDERLFGEWSMGFHDLDDPSLLTMPGFSPFMNQSLQSASFKTDSSGCMALFELFRGDR